MWLRETRAFLQDFIGAGFRGLVASVDPARLDPSFAGRPLDAAFARDLPPEIDPCGENGEFHTFVTDGPGFAGPVPVLLGEPRFEDALCYRELSCAAASAGTE